MRPSPQAADPFGRPHLAMRTTLIWASRTTATPGSVWPTRAGSDQAALDNNANATLSLEMLRIKALRADGQLDHYMLFANRRLTGLVMPRIRSYLASTCAISEGSILLCGLEQIELWLKRFPQAAQLADLDPIDSPLMVSSDELALVIEKLADGMPRVPQESPPERRVPYVEKNRLNQMTEEYASQLRKLYLKEAASIQAFLAAPENEEWRSRYESAVEEMQLNIVAKRKHYQTFDEVMNYLLKLLIARDPVLARNRRLTRAVLFYMYWNCDLGRSDDVAT